jgi:AAA domain, putative AbiEii toxin, Type IV TA system
MRIRSFEIRKTGPLELVSVSSLANTVVLAGPNGVGKTQIDNALLELAKNPVPNPNTWMIVEATREDEWNRWGKRILDTRQAQDANLLGAHMHRSQRRNRYQSSFLNFDSDRAIRNVQAYGFSWTIGDPFEEEIAWNLGLNPLQSRYNDVRHSLFRIVEGQRREIADRALRLQREGATQLPLTFPDVLRPFKDAFWLLLGPKKLVEVSTQNQEIYYEHNGAKLGFGTLSSGEKEVVNIVFDFILRNPQHCVVIFDEPELHLHPELSYKLLQALQSVGDSNQFILSTHSPEIISASLENTVVFVTPARDETYNQAVVVHRDDQTHHALQALGQSIGVISLGKKLVLIEGNEASLDKQTYGAILQGAYPEFVLVPVGGRDTLRSFDDVRESILNKTIWGVDFYLLCDRDAVNLLGPAQLGAVAQRNIKVLPRYHIENYFLDETILARVFGVIEPADSPRRNPRAIKAALLEIAASVIPYAVALNVAATVRERVGNVSIMAKGVSDARTAGELAAKILERVGQESTRLNAGLDGNAIAALVVSEHARLSRAVETDDPVWRSDLPGRIILNKFAATTSLQIGHLKQLYLSNAERAVTFAEIVALFEGFRNGR